MSSRGTCPAMVERARRHGLGRGRPSRREHRLCAECILHRQPGRRAHGRRARHLGQRGRSDCTALGLARMTVERASHDADHATPREETTEERPGNARDQREVERFSRYLRSTPCLITSDVTGDQGTARRSRGTTLGVRVDGLVSCHFGTEAISRQRFLQCFDRPLSA
jgi:hypothetical protein